MFLCESYYILSQITDLPNDLCFSAFHRKNGEEISYERKSDDDYEARAIFNLFRGQTLTLGEIKKRITLETPFVYHSRALKVLEDTMKIIHVAQPKDEEKKGAAGRSWQICPCPCINRIAKNASMGICGR